LDKVPFKERAILCLGILPIFIAIITYALTWAFIWDEGFHLIAAQLIAQGKLPYIDFCFPQTPLNAYINAGILLLFGNRWRPIHLAAALYLCLAIWMVADFVQSRLPSIRWRTPCGLAAAVVFGLNSMVVEFGPAAQAYATGIVFGVAAFRAALPVAAGRRLGYALLAGLCAGAAAASTLLTAPIPLVLLIWFIFFNGAGSRLLKTALYLFGCALPFIPVFVLYLKGPRQTLFNVIQYQAIYRRVNWGDAVMHDLDALTDWLNSPQALFLLVLLTGALIFLFRERHSIWPAAWRQFVLATALALALVAFISTAHPTFERYYCIAVPFLGIMAGLGTYAVGSRLASPKRAWLSGGLVMAFGYLLFARLMFDQRDADRWSNYEDMAHQLTAVAPLGTHVYAEEVVYFLLQEDPPDGQEFSYAQALELPPAEEKLFHITSIKELQAEMKAGKIKAFETCLDSTVDDFDPGQYYKKHTQPNDCDLFWDPKGPTAN
jgi:hypothetical protein